MQVVHRLVSHDGSGHVFHIRDDDNRDLIDGFISAFDHKLKVGAWSRSDLDAAEVAECAEAWKLAHEIVQLHEHCFIWKLEFEVEFPADETIDEVTILEYRWHIWAPTAGVAYQRFLETVANDPPSSGTQQIVCSAAMKGTWVRA